MKKIIFGITGLTLGGAERVLVDIANKLVLKYDVTIFTIYAGGELEKELDQRVHIISLFDFKYNSMGKFKKRIIPIRVLLEKKKIFKKYVENGGYSTQIAFLEGPITRIFSVKDKKSTKIAWIHNDISKVFGKGPKSRLKRLIDRNIYEKFDTLVFVSMDNLDKFNKIYDDMDLPHEKVINNYIDSERILKLAEEEMSEEDEKLLKVDKVNNVNEANKNNQVDRTSNFDKSDNANFIAGPTILQVSRLVSQKAIDRLIKVHSKLIKQGYNHRIFVVGDGPLKEKLEKQIQEENVESSFKLLGARENPYPLVKEADFFCLLSNFEGYPMVVEEAKILNKFILATNTATREALIDYASKSYIVSNNEEGVEEALKFAIKNYRQKNKQNNQYAYENNRIIDKIENMIEENKKHPDRTGKII
jgi:glycosyltransferase involved in cell wall biosynthesis